jgi:hypothetical protein
MVAGGSADLWIIRPDLQPVLVSAAAALVAGFAWLFRAAWSDASDAERREGRWLVAGAIASAVAFVGAPLGSRCLVLPMLGGSVAVALVLHHGWRSRWSGPLVAGVVAVAIVHLALAPLGRLCAPYLMRRMMSDRLEAAVADAPLDDAHLSGQRVVVLHAPDFIIGLHVAAVRALRRQPMPRSWRLLSWAPYPYRFTRTAPDTLELALTGGSITAPDLQLGDVVALDGMRATVLAADGRGPSRVAFQFDRPLDDPTLWFLTWRDDHLEHIVPPPVGHELVQ